MIERTLHVEKHDDGFWTVREGEAFCPHLCWDEMLGMLVTLTHRPGVPNYAMASIRGHLDREERRQAQIERLHQERSQDLTIAELVTVAHDFMEVLQEEHLLCPCGQPNCRTSRLRAVLAKAERMGL